MIWISIYFEIIVRAHAFVRACAHAFVRACAHVCERGSVCVCVCVCPYMHVRVCLRFLTCADFAVSHVTMVTMTSIWTQCVGAVCVFVTRSLQTLVLVCHQTDIINNNTNIKTLVMSAFNQLLSSFCFFVTSRVSFVWFLLHVINKTHFPNHQEQHKRILFMKQENAFWCQDDTSISRAIFLPREEMRIWSLSFPPGLF